MLFIIKMPRGIVLFEAEKSKILILKENKRSVTRIALKINRSRKLKYNFLKIKEKYGTNKNCERRKKFTDRDRRHI